MSRWRCARCDLVFGDEVANAAAEAAIAAARRETAHRCVEIARGQIVTLGDINEEIANAIKEEFGLP